MVHLARASNGLRVVISIDAQTRPVQTTRGRSWLARGMKTIGPQMKWRGYLPTSGTAPRGFHRGRGRGFHLQRLPLAEDGQASRGRLWPAWARGTGTIHPQIVPDLHVALIVQRLGSADVRDHVPSLQGVVGGLAERTGSRASRSLQYPARVWPAGPGSPSIQPDNPKDCGFPGRAERRYLEEPLMISPAAIRYPMFSAFGGVCCVPVRRSCRRPRPARRCCRGSARRQSGSAARTPGSRSAVHSIRETIPWVTEICSPPMGYP